MKINNIFFSLFSNKFIKPLIFSFDLNFTSNNKKIVKHYCNFKLDTFFETIREQNFSLTTGYGENNEVFFAEITMFNSLGEPIQCVTIVANWDGSIHRENMYYS